MVTLDLSGLLSDWASHFLLGSAGASLASLLMLTMWSSLFKRVGFRHQDYAFWQLLCLGLGMLAMCSSAALFASLALHYAQDYYWGSLIHIEFVWRIL